VERLAAYVNRQQEQVSPQRVVLPGPHEDHGQRKGVSLDGGMVNVREEGWKEFKAGAIFDVRQRLVRDPTTRELVEQPYAVNTAYTAVLGSAEQFAPALWKLAVRTAVPQAADSSVTADGTEWIWNLAADFFPDSVQIVDWYHACEHLAGAASALYPEDAQAAQRWYQLGSGTVESGIKQFKARLTGPGIRWSRPNAERILIIRAAVLADTFDALWAAAA
jgi:hypothetical protein